jgi:hypothetical protein
MPNVSPDVALQMAASWNQIQGNSDLAQAIDVWPCCQILAQAGVIVGQERDLAAMELGPFRIAVTSSASATRDFIEVLFPAVVASLPTGQPLMGAVSGMLSAACLTFVKLLERTIVFGRSTVDLERWTVLMYIKSCNETGVSPTICEVMHSVARRTQWEIRPKAVEMSIAWLTENGDNRGQKSRSQLVQLDMATGGLESLV